jgi:ribosomal protein S18 acetylase RimI-like enzyme
MRRGLADGYELDDDVARVDVDVVHRYLSEESYWAQGRPRETVERLVREASRVIGVYRGGEMVGFCRVSSDGTAYAFLCDVFVLSEHRGRGLGVEMVREAVDGGPQRDLPWYLGTGDAHRLYRRFGFGEPNERLMFRPRPNDPVAGRFSGPRR